MKVARQKNEDKGGEKPALFPFIVSGTRERGMAERRK